MESVESSNEVFNQLMYRLTKFNSANVKAKSLRCMRSIARGGNPVFKVKLIEAKEEIRKCLCIFLLELSYSCPHFSLPTAKQACWHFFHLPAIIVIARHPLTESTSTVCIWLALFRVYSHMHGFTAYKAPHDPIRGEELTALVHTETQELLNSLYETADEQNPMAHSAHFSSMEGGKEDPQPQQGAGVFGTVYNAVCFVFVLFCLCFCCDNCNFTSHFRYLLPFKFDLFKGNEFLITHIAK